MNISFQFFFFLFIENFIMPMEALVMSFPIGMLKNLFKEAATKKRRGEGVFTLSEGSNRTWLTRSMLL